MNKKGQTLVIFILFLPIIACIILMIINKSNMYYDKRNIHFYVNRCGFKIVEFFNPKHKDPHQKGESAGNIPEENNYFFRFEKEMN